MVYTINISGFVLQRDFHPDYNNDIREFLPRELILQRMRASEQVNFYIVHVSIQHSHHSPLDSKIGDFHKKLRNLHHVLNGEKNL